MFTVTFIVHEGTALSREQALAYWRDTHAPLVTKVPGVIHYVQHHAVAGPDEKIPFLGVATLGFADRAAFEQGAGSSEFAAALADLSNFGDPEQLPTAFTEQVTVVG